MFTFLLIASSCVLFVCSLMSPVTIGLGGGQEAGSGLGPVLLRLAAPAFLSWWTWDLGRNPGCRSADLHMLRYWPPPLPLRGASVGVMIGFPEQERQQLPP